MEAAAQSQTKPPFWHAGSLVQKVSAGAALVAGAVLRAWMLVKFFQANGDTYVYGGIARNLLLHGAYALTLGPGHTVPTLIRLPGYPWFLAACFKAFGMENYGAVAWLQIVLALAGCLLLADFARRIAPHAMKTSAMQATLWLVALCPFTAVYDATPLTEGPTLFLIALALWVTARFREKPGWGPALGFTFAVTYAALLRPDGPLVAVALAPALIVRPRQEAAAFARGRQVLRMALVCILLALVPFVAWTWRNWQVFHIFEPLVPASATDPGDPVYAGWDRWVKTWCLDFVSTYEVYWNMPGDELDIGQLPDRAFDSAAQREQTAKLFAEYNGDGYVMTPAIDAGFRELARERISTDPLRYYAWLPMGRVMDMWLRPRVENLPIDLDWWVYAHHNSETRISWFYAGLNALYILLGIAGLCLRPRLWPWMLLYMVLRSAMLLTIGAPEARYTLECFPMLFALGGVAIAGAWRGIKRTVRA